MDPLAAATITAFATGFLLGMGSVLVQRSRKQLELQAENTRLRTMVARFDHDHDGRIGGSKRR